MILNIHDDILKLHTLGLLDKLLLDKTTGKHIMWATDAYSALGSRYSRNEEIMPELITGSNASIIKTRARKEMEQQSSRTRQRGEVFTPLWVCRKMCDYADGMWGGKGGWQKYVNARVLEITCGEAPFLVSRYDAETGEAIPIPVRIGLLDRKLRTVNENTQTEEEWLKWVFRAFWATYGYEFQGDNLLIARVNLLMTFEEYLLDRWKRKPTLSEYGKLITVIVWNIWQMDGLTGRIPYGTAEDEFQQFSLFAAGDQPEGNNQPCCRIYNWTGGGSVGFEALPTRGRRAMKFDFVIGNPPYQEETNGVGRQAKPLYNLFMEQVKELHPQAISLIIPSRWFAGGIGLDSFRTSMMTDRKLKYLVDYVNAKDCFPNTSISGGVCCFLWDSKYCGDCKFTNINGRNTTTMVRPLDEFPVLVRYNQAVSIIHKIRTYQENPITDIVSPISPFGLSTKERGSAQKENQNDLRVYSSVGSGFIPRSEVSKGIDYIDCYKLMVSQTSAEHAGEAGKDGKFRVLTSSMKVISPGEVCTHSYIVIGRFETKQEALNILSYMRTRFTRLLLLLAMSSIHLSKMTFSFVPLQDFTPTSDIDWTKSIPEIDQQLYKKYGLDETEIQFIETHVKEMK